MYCNIHPNKSKVDDYVFPVYYEDEAFTGRAVFARYQQRGIINIFRECAAILFGKIGRTKKTDTTFTQQLIIFVTVTIHATSNYVHPNIQTTSAFWNNVVST